MKSYDLFGTIFMIIKIFYGKCVLVASMSENFPYFCLQTFLYSSRSRSYCIIEFIIEFIIEPKGYSSFAKLSNIYLIVLELT